MAFTNSKKAALPLTVEGDEGRATGRSSAKAIPVAYSDDGETTIFLRPSVCIEDILVEEEEKSLRDEVEGMDIERMTKLRELLNKKFFDHAETTRGARFMPAPNDSLGREVVLVGGPAGAGKSVFCSAYARGYHTRYPDRKIYLLSEKPEDPILDELKYIDRLNLEDLRPEIAMEETKTPTGRSKFTSTKTYQDYKQFKNSLLIADDLDAIADPLLMEGVLKLVDSITKLGRSSGISLVYTTHKLLGGRYTMPVIEHATRYVFFPRASASQVERFISTYGKSYKHLLGRILGGSLTYNEDETPRRPSHWISLSISHPMHLLSEREILSVK